MRQTLNNFIIIKSIIIIILKFMPKLKLTKYNNKPSCACLTAKENRIVFFSLTHANYFSKIWQYFALSSPDFFSSSFSFSCSSPWLFLTLCNMPTPWFYKQVNCLSLLFTVAYGFLVQLELGLFLSLDNMLINWAFTWARLFACGAPKNIPL